MKIAIVGAGSWGTAFGRYLHRLGHQVAIYGRNPDKLRLIRQTGRNEEYLPGIDLPPDMLFSSDISQVIAGAELLVNAISSQYIRRQYAQFGDVIPEDLPIINLSKGIELKSLQLIHQVFGEIYPANPYAALSGPSHAEEVAIDMPTTLVVASKDETLAHRIQSLSSRTLRIYRSDDLLGVETGGALKNIIALATGVSDGIGFGDNTQAAIMTRGMAEIMRLGAALGAKTETFLGLSGFGDLIVTCTSRHSRNRRCGYLIGRGETVEQAIAQVGMVVEGIRTMEAAHSLAAGLGIDMPLTQALYDIIHEGASVADTITELMERDYKQEFNL